jgi:hypothetical protein
VPSARPLGIQPEPASTSRHEEIKPWQIILQKVLDLAPPPLGYALIVGMTLLIGVTGFIDSAFRDFDLRLTLSSMWFLLALGAACIAWLAATILARKRLRWTRLTGFAILFSVVGVASGWYAWRTAQYEYNELGFYEQTSWQSSHTEDKAKAAHFEWRIEAVKPTVATLSFEMPADPNCKYTDFQPPPPPVRSSANRNEMKLGWNACVYESEGSPDVIIENLGRGGSVVFTLYPANASVAPASCKLPVVRTTKEHC